MAITPEKIIEKINVQRNQLRLIARKREGIQPFHPGKAGIGQTRFDNPAALAKLPTIAKGIPPGK
jgi:hypothetical protein